MRLHVSLLLAALALHARAATIPGTPQIEKKLPPAEVPKDVPAENVSSEQELIDSAQTVKDVENNLRVKTIDSIPVSVIVDGDVSNPDENEVTPDIKRAPLDLEHPGEPQRQEHETQNAVHYNEEQLMVSTLEQTVLDSQNSLKQGFQGVTQGIQDWIANNEQLSAIQASINNLQENFKEQISKLNTTIQTFWNNRIQPDVPEQVEVDTEPQIKNVESHLKLLENNFETGVNALSEGVKVFATLKAETGNATAPAPTAPNNLFVQYLQLFQNTLTQGFNNVTHALQNYVNNGNNGTTNPGLLQSFNNGIQNIFNPSTSTTPAGAQGDPVVTSRPTIWQGIQSSLQNILNPGQVQGQASGTQGSTGTPNRPIASAIQNLPFVQGVVNLIQPPKPAAQPTTAAPAKPADAPLTEDGSNVLPLPEKKPDDVKPATEPVKDQAAPVPVNGPIRNIIQNNPIVKGISGAVQKLQASITNPEKPREEEKKPEKEESQNGDVKGHYGYGGGHNTNAGDNNNFDGVVKSVPEKVVPQEPIAEDLKVVEDTKEPVAAEPSDKTDQS